MISIISAPESAPQRYTPPPQPRPAPPLDALDRRIIEAVRDIGPVKTWSLFNWLSEDEGARSRADGRDARRGLWDRVKRLKRLKLIFGAGRNELAAEKPERQPTRPRPRPRRRRRTVAEPPGLLAVSADISPSLPEQPDYNYVVEGHLAAKDSVISHGVEKPEKSESVITPEQASMAARALAKLPRQQRKWTGWLHGQHCWRGRLVTLPNGEITKLYWVNRGRVLLEDAHDLPYRSWLLRVARREEDVRLHKNPAAVVLGSLKRGVRERKSEAKASAARLNGAMPCRPGRRRGRPLRTRHPMKYAH